MWEYFTTARAKNGPRITASLPHPSGFFSSPLGWSIRKPYREFSRDEMVRLHRCHLEVDHFIDLRRWSYDWPLEVPLSDDAWSPYEQLHSGQLKDTCNRSVGIYTALGSRVFRMVMMNYVYRRWYRPFKSDIENNRFIAKFLLLTGEPADFDWLPRGNTPADMEAEADPESSQPTVHTVPERPEPPPSAIDTLISRHRTLCEEAEKRREHFKQIAADPGYSRNEYKYMHHHVLQPLFRAVIILASYDFYINQTSQTIGNMPVFVIRTGVNDGLSGPVTFDFLSERIDPASHYHSSRNGTTVKVSLEAAIDFIQYLEARELAVYGPVPDPAVTVAEKGGREGILMFDETKQDYVVTESEGPSHEWVDIEKHPEWIPGATDPEISSVAHQMSYWERIRLMFDNKGSDWPWKKVPEWGNVDEA
ncbi:hypothetical protein V8F20_002978 [Naviculisporaceae sp. PSN 640]